jgi:hypothetical protein
MRRICRKLAGSTAIVALLSVSGLALAQDADEQAAPQDSAPTMSQAGNSGFCMPGCIVPPSPGQGIMNQGQMPMTDQGMTGQGMMGQGMMNQSQMPMTGQGMTGQGMMGQGMMGQGMMNQGHMPMMGMAMMNHEHMAMMNDAAMMAPGIGHFLARDLTVDDARHLLEHRLVAFGLPNLKVEAVEETDGDTIIVDVVTKDGVLVQRLSVDRHTGHAVPIE